MQIDSILQSTKRHLGIQEEYGHFDCELIDWINAAFSTLHQLGVGPESPYRISSADNIWSEFIQNEAAIESVREYVYLKVRLVFDPPSSSAVIDAFERYATELEWRLNAASESGEVT